VVSSTNRETSDSDIGRQLSRYMHTGADVYEHMEVCIVKGDAKIHMSIISASRHVDGKLVLDVWTTTWTTNTVIQLFEQDVKELQ
jgi:thiamine phosphate synthase YjbQ (UPF0047 family)